MTPRCDDARSPDRRPRTVSSRTRPTRHSHTASWLPGLADGTSSFSRGRDCTGIGVQLQARKCPRYLVRSGIFTDVGSHQKLKFELVSSGIKRL